MKSDIKKRLAQCFQSVFPQLSDAQAEQASQESLADWDSIATVKLVTVIAEEFGVELDVDYLAEMTSFDRFHTILVRETQHGRDSGV